MKTHSNNQPHHLLRTLRKLACRWYVMLPLCGLLLLVSCQHEPLPQPANQRAWSGQELFKGLLLMDGPVANRIATYATLQQKYRFNQQPGLKQELARLGQQFVKAIDEGHPGFFARFQRGIQSGDHLQVEAAMKQGSEMLQYAIQQDPQLRPHYAKGVEIASKINWADVTDAQGRVDQAKLAAIADQYRNASPDSEEAKAMIRRPYQAIARQATYSYPYIWWWPYTYRLWIDLDLDVIWFYDVELNSSNGATPTDLQREMVIQEITEELVLKAR